MLPSPFPHQALLQRCIVSPGGALPREVPLRIDPGEQGEPRQGRVLPVHQTLLEGAAGLRTGLGVLPTHRCSSGDHNTHLSPPTTTSSYLQTQWGDAELSSAAVAEPHRLLLSLRLLRPRQRQRGSEEEAGFQTPVCWVFPAGGRGNGGRSNGLGALWGTEESPQMSGGTLSFLEKANLASDLEQRPFSSFLLHVQKVLVEESLLQEKTGQLKHEGRTFGQS